MILVIEIEMIIILEMVSVMVTVVSQSENISLLQGSIIICNICILYIIIINIVYIIVLPRVNTI